MARFAVVFLDQAPFPDEIYFLDDESLCGGEPRCPNALVTYTSSRITHAQCAWKVGSRCEIRSTETIMETPESPEVRRCWHYTIEVIAAPRKLGERGKIRLASRPGDNLTAPGPIEVLVAGSK